MARTASSTHAPRPPVYRVPTAWGIAHVTSDGCSILRFEPPNGALRDADPDGIDVGEDAPALVHELAERLVAYFAGEPVQLAEPDDVARWLTAAGVTGFRHAALRTLAEVPRGVTIAYGELAALAGRPGAARAVGSTCASNPLPVLVPCHRVIHAGARPGDVGAYGASSGSAYKRRLLELEDAALVRGTGFRAAGRDVGTDVV